MTIATHQSSLTKTTGPNIRIRAITQTTDRVLSITWTDGKSDNFDVVELRRKCPCASCIDEWTHEPLLKASDVSETVRPLKVESVGQYALTLPFSDGHRTGIYTFSYLRKLADVGR